MQMQFMVLWTKNENGECTEGWVTDGFSPGVPFVSDNIEDARALKADMDARHEGGVYTHHVAKLVLVDLQ